MEMDYQENKGDSEVKEIELKLADISISRGDAATLLHTIKQNIENDRGIKEAINIYVTQFIPLENRKEGSDELLRIIQCVFDVFSDTLKEKCTVM